MRLVFAVLFEWFYMDRNHRSFPESFPQPLL